MAGCSGRERVIAWRGGGVPRGCGSLLAGGHGDGGIDRLFALLLWRLGICGTGYCCCGLLLAAGPSEGEQAADRLSGLQPRMGHLQHMPSHLYIRCAHATPAAPAKPL